MGRFNPYKHISETDGDREKIIEALFWVWELMVDGPENAWISDREVKIAHVAFQAGREET